MKLARRKAITYHLIEKLTRELPVTLDPAEREALKDRENELGERVDELEREHETIRAAEREDARARRESIAEARAAWRKTMSERRTGTAQREFKCELRGVIATQSIDLVRVHDGEIIETRPMSEEERVKYLQGNLLPEAESTLAYSTGDLPALTDGAPLAEDDEPEDDDLVGDDERAALGGLPRGWPKRWLNCEWTVEGEPLPLTGGDIFEVYLRIATTGSTVDMMCEAVNWLGRGHVVRSLALLLRRKLAVVTDGGLWFAAEEAPEVETEAGRNDPLPEASAAKKPRRRGAKDTGEAAINGALGQSEAMEATA